MLPMPISMIFPQRTLLPILATVRPCSKIITNSSKQSIILRSCLSEEADPIVVAREAGSYERSENA